MRHILIQGWWAADWFLGALAGVFLTLIGQAIIDAFKERRRISSVRVELYQSLAEILAVTGVYLNSLQKVSNNMDAVDRVLTSYQQFNSADKYGQQLIAVKQERPQLGREADAFVEILQVLSTAAGTQGDRDHRKKAIDSVSEKFMYELRMKHLNNDELTKYLRLQEGTGAVESYKKAVIAIEDAQSSLRQVTEAAASLDSDERGQD